MSVIDTLQALQFIFFWLRSRPSPRPHIFITGAPRSGTTLLKTLLVAHSQIGGTDYESTGIFKFRNFSVYETGELGKTDTQLILRHSDSIVTFYDAYTDAILRRRNKQLFVDKIWPRRHRLSFLTSRFPNARWLHIIRDGRDCYCSARLHPHIPQTRDVRTFARYWKQCIILSERLLAQKRTYILRYEDLTANPEQVTKAIMDFLGVPFETQQLQPTTRAQVTSLWRRHEHSRLKGTINGTSVGRWKNELTFREVSVFEEVAIDVLRRLGYCTG